MPNELEPFTINSVSIVFGHDNNAENNNGKSSSNNNNELVSIQKQPMVFGVWSSK